jgi:PAS domain-containing protein
VPAWIKEDFGSLPEVLDQLDSPVPRCAWSPEAASLPEPRLGSMYSLWKARAGDHDLPPVEDCRPDVYGELASVMMFLDFREDGMSLRYRHYGEELAASANMNWTGRTTVDMAYFMENSLLYASSYLASAARREPLYAENVSRPKLLTTTWCRLLLPHVDAKAGVVSFACGNIPMPGFPTWPPVRGRGGEPRPQVSPPEGRITQDFLRMERNLRDILTLTRSAVMIVEPEAGTTYFMNDPMRSLLGCAFPRLKYTRPDDIFEDPGHYDKALEQIRANGAVRSLEVRLRGAGGNPCWTLMSAHEVFFDNRPRIAFWFYDITDQKNTEEALRIAQSQKEETIRQLQEALERVRSLEGIIPICSYCKKVRNDQQYWLQVEHYISERTQAKFSHGICPECRARVISEELKERGPQEDP